ncbi:hypothetical protein F5J12DRAFT_783948 [Pisolithus orientalis]|uniref:uncharacterized protein n=1 Tax=Pisolithus orientalis TaxID=936130 RepID=UPI0022249F80|nr:uncharacterized protein F5J12DRAFT_783948 [Pisolithus orientalis]KAI6002182.1 hypothetical protein F5J12DRAFT_783948 [Pisolithus orientalis]
MHKVDTFAHLPSSLHFYSLLINSMPGECLVPLMALEGLEPSRVVLTPSDGGTTSYSTTQGIEDCQLSLATLESIFYFLKETQLFMLPADSVHFACWDTNQDSLARFLTFLVNTAFSPLSIKTDESLSICPLYILFDIYYARGMFGASPTKCQGLGALGSSQRLGAFESHLGMDIP